ncbi:solute carrier family 22 member 21-like [Ruditapes philippinarum]|uniref:solute carrier family 22 member 21-like n=1 Tax=Ruditapes philippinarum TaxID=129788 RepID=UPI00295AD9AB|nr:solute carrier family 22 member 21-like [Ruditapes philippinarum]
MVLYAITFGIQALSGNIYLNLFLFSIAGIPTKIIALWLQNRFGRRISSVLCFIAVAASGFVVGVVQSIDASNKDILTNVFSIIASVGINTAWGPVQTMTIEVYPTVVRNIGMGSMNTMARIGAIIGPQLVYLNYHVPGLMYYVCGAIGVLCILSQLWLPETKDSNLNDKF